MIKVDPSTPLPTTRRAAREQRLPLYDTGRACHYGHHSPRYVSSKVCVSCGAAAGRAYRAAHGATIKTDTIHTELSLADRIAAVLFPTTLTITKDNTHV